MPADAVCSVYTCVFIYTLSSSSSSSSSLFLLSALSVWLETLIIIYSVRIPDATARLGQHRRQWDRTRETISASAEQQHIRRIHRIAILIGRADQARNVRARRSAACIHSTIARNDRQQSRWNVAPIPFRWLWAGAPSDDGRCHRRWNGRSSGRWTCNRQHCRRLNRSWSAQLLRIFSSLQRSSLVPNPTPA